MIGVSGKRESKEPSLSLCPEDDDDDDDAYKLTSGMSMFLFWYLWTNCGPMKKKYYMENQKWLIHN